MLTTGLPIFIVICIAVLGGGASVWYMLNAKESVGAVTVGVTIGVAVRSSAGATICTTGGVTSLGSRTPSTAVPVASFPAGSVAVATAVCTPVEVVGTVAWLLPLSVTGLPSTVSVVEATDTLSVATTCATEDCPASTSDGVNVTVTCGGVVSGTTSSVNVCVAETW